MKKVKRRKGAGKAVKVFMEGKIKCSYCRRGRLVLVGADEPWHGEYLICPGCDSTYLKENISKGTGHG